MIRKGKRVLALFDKMRSDYHLGFLASLIIIVWFSGAIFLYIYEGDSNPAFDSVGKAYWNIAVYLFSGLDSGVPLTTAGKFTVAIILVISAIGVAVLTASIASLLVEFRAKGRFLMPSTYTPRNHIVICNWNKKGLPLLQELHSEILSIKRTIIVISESDGACEFPEDQGDSAFDNVMLVRGNPARDYVLRRANVQEAHSVIILSESAGTANADGHAMMVCMAIKSVCDESGSKPSYITAEVDDPKNVHHFKRAGADEVVCEGDYGMRLLAQSAVEHGLTNVYKNLLTFSANTNELYVLDIPESVIGLSFSELGKKIYEARSNFEPVILVGCKTAEGEFLLNPRSAEQKFRPDDKAIVVAWQRPKSLSLLLEENKCN